MVAQDRLHRARQGRAGGGAVASQQVVGLAAAAMDRRSAARRDAARFCQNRQLACAATHFRRKEGVRRLALEAATSAPADRDQVFEHDKQVVG